MSLLPLVEGDSCAMRREVCARDPQSRRRFEAGGALRGRIFRCFTRGRSSVWLVAASLIACSGQSSCMAGCASRSTSPQQPEQEERAVFPDPALPGLGKGSQKLNQKLREALEKKGADYQPRTHHLEGDGSPTYTNRLILETSPYLLQHAHNPVNWFSWGEEALARAQEEDKPILLSVGYSTCHWCHVMERESFEDEEIARYINEHFIPIKVDREERPDIDSIYMDAVRLLSGRGGWPMTVLLTPDREPFFGGTYFPARDGDRGARKGFLTILREMYDQYMKDRDGVIARAQRLSRKLRHAADRARPAGVPSHRPIELAVELLEESFDPAWGGFGRAPKFPKPATLELLLRFYRRTGDEEALEAVVTTLQKMARGGIYDQIGGGFHRYSTDRRWLVPHFEKMLYDNAQLVPIYLAAYQLTEREEFARISQETLDYLLRDMRAASGGFFSATDADSLTPDGHREEGYYFTWTPNELAAALKPKLLKTAKEYYNVSPGGNFEGRSILYRPRDDRAVAETLGISLAELQERLTEIKKRLRPARDQRLAPLRDEKILTSWNGLMISAMARGGFVLNQKDYIAAAEAAAEFLLDNSMENNRLLRSFKDGSARHPGFLDDYAFLIAGLLDLYEATSQPRWLRQAIELQRVQDELFWDQQDGGGYFLTSSEHKELIARQKPDHDGAEPSGNSVATQNLQRLFDITHQESYRQRSEAIFSAFSSILRTAPTSLTKMLSALEHSLNEPLEVFIVAPEPGVSFEPLARVVREMHLPYRVLTFTVQGEPLERRARLVAGLEGKRALSGKLTAYVCKRGVCKQPAYDAKTLAEQLRDAAQLVGFRR